MSFSYYKKTPADSFVLGDLYEIIADCDLPNNQLLEYADSVNTSHGYFIDDDGDSYVLPYSHLRPAEPMVTINGSPVKLITKELREAADFLIDASKKSTFQEIAK